VTNTKHHATKKQLIWATVTVTIVMVGALLFVAEYYLRGSNKFANYYEINEEAWNPDTTKEVLVEPWLWINPRNGSRVFEKEEYRQEFHFGPEGLPKQAIPLEKDKNEYRIAVVGDSFIQGFGDTEGPGVVARLQNLIDENKKSTQNIRFLNAGIGGSDPVFEKEFLARELLKYKPDLIVLSINFSDIRDIKRRGGLDRFTSDGQLKTVLPWWIWIYNHSHVFRAFASGVMGYDSDLDQKSDKAANDRAATDDLTEAVLAINELGQNNSFKLFVVIHPMKFELEGDQLAAPLLISQQDLIKKGINIADLTPEFRKQIPPKAESDYYWEKDGHYKSKGYAVFASAIAAELQARGYLK